MEGNYFAYGSNMDPIRMKNRRIDFLDRKKGILNDYKLVFNKKASSNPKMGYANIEKELGAIVEGVLYRIKGEDFFKLDHFEGFPKHYTKIDVIIKNDKDEKIESITYKAQKDEIQENIKPSKKYIRHLLAAKDVLSKDYYCSLLKIKTID